MIGENEANNRNIWCERACIYWNNHAISIYRPPKLSLSTATTIQNFKSNSKHTVSCSMRPSKYDDCQNVVHILCAAKMSFAFQYNTWNRTTYSMNSVEMQWELSSIMHRNRLSMTKYFKCCAYICMIYITTSLCYEK